MDERGRRKELGHFLRTRRERLQPDRFGLPRGRRRTPGLRREELAQLAGVGVTWYTWLEQGRDIRVSAEVLEGLARTLELGATERAHLAALARRPLPPRLPGITEAITPAVQAVLDQQEPAYVMGRRWDVLGWNRAAAALFGDFAGIPPAQRNMVRLLFTAPSFRSLLADWEGHARRVVGQFRASYGQAGGDPWFEELVHDLQAASPEFRVWWAAHDVQGRPEGRREFEHPVVGRLVLWQLTLQPTESAELRLVLYAPLAEADTPAKLARLAEASPT